MSNQHLYNSLPGKYLWSEEAKERYILALLDEESINKLTELNDSLDNPSDDINMIADKLNNIYRNAADKSLIFKTVGKSMKHGNTRKSIPKKKWMTQDCLSLKREVTSLSKKLTRDPDNYNLRQTFSSCRSRYNKMIKRLRANHFHSLADKINALNPKISKEFWNSIKDVQKDDRPATPILYPIIKTFSR